MYFNCILSDEHLGLENKRNIELYCVLSIPIYLNLSLNTFVFIRTHFATYKYREINRKMWDSVFNRSLIIFFHPLTNVPSFYSRVLYLNVPFLPSEKSHFNTLTCIRNISTMIGKGNSIFRFFQHSGQFSFRSMYSCEMADIKLDVVNINLEYNYRYLRVLISGLICNKMSP